ncbi:FkbM family methyltransferase [Lutimaribacter sp. EGI FJ00015]|uniref:FkbM family methyltransferase n=1 Tax=Lutimaribacter degradans TaxID=2945989 RepID=A0ACC5ZX91_9RHOB|nr:FkbM family methyltransferase [Lutimaribacter sp. EGI FJ00013]MCM2562813.1 FkbM family methyltransferase [Lutimaribacter sp. EGI FJ00013]MCO0613970.1 FkbM family methyltransferase [Lutimaribacter sp. EGI FJ00015]MCO0636942.1 FkbM family methyltransferase [Lutimaribacter sp. EGI FJ00014]
MVEFAARAMAAHEQRPEDDSLSDAFGTYRPNMLQRALIGLARATPLHRGRLRHITSQWIYRMGRPLDIERLGCNFRVGNRDNLIEYGLLLNPGYNQSEIEFLSAPLGPGSVALDIGSNIGLYTLPLAKTGARVIAIDANPVMAAQLRFNLRASGMSDADVANVAVGDSDGMGNLEIRRDDVAMVNVVADEAGGAIPIRRLDSVLAEMGVTRVDVLKIDIEGFEDKALAPYLAQAQGDMIPRRIVIERAGPQDYPACFEQFERLGFTLHGRTRNNSMYVRPE